MPELKPLLRHATSGARTFWFSVLPPAAFLGGFIAIFGPTNKAFLYSGLSLQLLGLILVARAIADTLRTHNEAPIGSRARAWFVTFFQLAGLRRPASPPTIVGLGGSSISLGARGSATLTPAPTTVEERVHALERALGALSERVSKTEETLSKNLQAIRSELASLGARIDDTAAELRAAIRQEAIEGIHWEVIGLVWLIAGTLLATIPDELARLFASSG